MSGERFALPAQPHGILTNDERIRAVAGTRIAYRDGIAVAVMEGDNVRRLIDEDVELRAASGVR